MAEDEKVAAIAETAIAAATALGEGAANPLLDAALEWSELCRVAPCKGKNPGGYLGLGWQRRSSRDRGRIRQWWRRWPEANVGIVPGKNLLPVDVDDPDIFQDFQREHGAPPPTPRCYTNGVPGILRERLIFRHPGVELNDELCSGVQLRDGDRVSVVPPSVNPRTGEAYEWRDAPDEVPIAPLPSEWLERARRRQTGRRKPTTSSEWRRLAAGVTDGSVSGEAGRKKGACRLAGYLFARGVDPYVVLELLITWDTRNRPPLGPSEVERAVDWAAEREAARWME
jgi:hypothetical protein